MTTMTGLVLGAVLILLVGALLIGALISRCWTLRELRQCSCRNPAPRRDPTIPLRDVGAVRRGRPRSNPAIYLTCCYAVRRNNAERTGSHLLDDLLDRADQRLLHRLESSVTGPADPLVHAHQGDTVPVHDTTRQAVTTSPSMHWS